MSDRVSIIVPTRNRRGLLRQALHSASGQTWSNTELLVVDEASNDGTVEMLRTEFPGARIVHNNPPRGPGGARNVGIAAAEGDWILFLDDDDLLHPEHVESLISASRDVAANCVVSGQWRRFTVTGGTVRLGPIVCAPWDRSPMEALAEVLEPRGEGTLWTSSALWPRKLCTETQWDDQLYTNGDVDFFGRMLLHGVRIVGRPAGMAYYRGHIGQRVAGSSSLRGLLSGARFRLKWSQLLLSHPDHQICAASMRNGFMTVMIGLAGVPEAAELMPFLQDAYRLWGGQGYYMSSPPRHPIKRIIAEAALKLGGPAVLQWILKYTSRPDRLYQAQLLSYHRPATDADESDVAAIRAVE